MAATAERGQKEIDQLSAKKIGKNIEQHLLMTPDEARNAKNYQICALLFA
jgi:putative cell wall-binding protein